MLHQLSTASKGVVYGLGKASPSCHKYGGQFERFMLEKDGSRYQECARQAETEDSAEKVQCSML